MYNSIMFYFDEINGKKILKSDLLEDVRHFFTTRETVIKSNEKDYQTIVAQNKKDICEYLNITADDFISPSQTHSANIMEAKIGQTDYPETDGLILTNQKQGIFLNFADCVPIILYDGINNIAAISHAGWRGTAQRIAVLTVEKMINEYNSQAENILAVIGPAISKCCYNIGFDVMEKLSAAAADKSDLFEERGNKIFADLKEINRRQLTETGIKKIDVCPYCTVCDNDMFFSYRKENAASSRHSAVICLKQ